MPPDSVGEYALKIAVALLCGAAIGMERQWRHRMSLLRTNALVAVGAALFVSIAELSHNAEKTRVVAQVASGVGFIGAGIMLRDGLNVRGLNTAATLWCAAAVGCLSGMGYYIPAAVGVVGVLTANVGLRPLAQRLNILPEDTTEIVTYYRVSLVCREGTETRVRQRLLVEMHEHNVQLMGLETTAEAATGRKVQAILIADGDKSDIIEAIVAHFGPDADIAAASWERLTNVQRD